jgi:flagellar motility protein MotE (MotC chaperone)
MTDAPDCPNCALMRAAIEIAAQEFATVNEAMKTATTHVQQVEQIVAGRAALLSIEQTGRLLVFKFVRHNEIHVIETYSTMSDDVPGWKKALLE